VALFFAMNAKPPKSPVSGYFITHPYSTPAKITSPEPSTTPTNTVKCSFLGN